MWSAPVCPSENCRLASSLHHADQQWPLPVLQIARSLRNSCFFFINIPASQWMPERCSPTTGMCVHTKAGGNEDSPKGQEWNQRPVHEAAPAQATRLPPEANLLCLLFNIYFYKITEMQSEITIEKENLQLAIRLQGACGFIGRMSARRPIAEVTRAAPPLSWCHSCFSAQVARSCRPCSSVCVGNRRPYKPLTRCNDPSNTQRSERWREQRREQQTLTFALTATSLAVTLPECSP